MPVTNTVTVYTVEKAKKRRKKQFDIHKCKCYDIHFQLPDNKTIYDDDDDVDDRLS